MTTPMVMLVGPGRSGKDTAGEAIAREFGGVCVALTDPIKRFCADRRTFGLTADELWGKAKDTEVALSSATPNTAECTVALSEALHSWKTPSELSGLPFASWLRSLPHFTTPRHIMQTFGTQCVRAVWPNFWVEHALWTAERLLEGGWVYDRQLGLAGGAAAHAVVCFTDGRFRNEVLGVKRAGGVVLRVVRPEAQVGFSDAAKQHASETEQATIPAWWFDTDLVNDGTLGQFQGQAIASMQHFLVRGFA